jgi:hypothetical protein
LRKRVVLENAGKVEQTALRRHWKTGGRRGTDGSFNMLGGRSNEIHYNSELKTQFKSTIII